MLAGEELYVINLVALELRRIALDMESVTREPMNVTVALVGPGTRTLNLMVVISLIVPENQTAVAMAHVMLHLTHQFVLIV